MHAGDKAIPQELLRKAQCVGVIPNLKRAGFIVGAKYGKSERSSAGKRKRSGLERSGDRSH